MKRYFFLLFCLSIILPIAGQDRLNNSEKKEIIEKVQKYCDLLKQFSSNIEKIELMDTLFEYCENERVQTYNDLQSTTKANTVESYSLPLFQYLQDITFNYDNKLALSFSDFKCESVVDEPVTLSENKTYATVHFKKSIKGDNISKSVNELVKVNLENFKISGTILEDFENPDYIYITALGYYQNGKIDKALEAFKKCTNSTIFSGRYRAMTMCGRIYVEKKNWNEAISWLSKASEQDPSASLLLALVYTGQIFLNTSIEVPIQYQNKALALELLTRNVDNIDVDYPEIALQSMVRLASIYLEGMIVPRNYEKFFGLLKKLVPSNFPPSLYSGCTFFTATLLTLYKMINEDFKSAYKMTDMLQHESILLNFNEQAIASIEQQKEVLQKAMNNVDPFYNYVNELVNKKEYEKAIIEFRKLAENGDPYACNVMYMYYYPIDGQPQSDFDVFLYNNKDKNKKKAISYLRKAADKGDLQCIYYLSGLLLIDEEIRDIDESIKWTLFHEDNSKFDRKVCLAGLIPGFVAENKDLQTSILEKIIQYAATSGAANFIISTFYKENNPELYEKYTNDGAQMGYFPCMYNQAENYLKSHNLDDVEKTANKMIEKGYHEGYVFIGKSKEAQGIYKEAFDAYITAYNKKNYDAAISIAHLYHDGKFVEKSLEKAKEYLQQGIMWAKEELDNVEAQNAEQLFAQWIQEPSNVQEENSADNNHNGDNTNSQIAKNLEQLTDPSLDPDKKIELSELLISTLFESQNSIVKTVSANGSTIVATQKVEDFMLQLVSYNRKITIEVITKEMGTADKIKSLSIMIK